MNRQVHRLRLRLAQLGDYGSANADLHGNPLRPDVLFALDVAIDLDLRGRIREPRRGDGDVLRRLGETPHTAANDEREQRARLAAELFRDRARVSEQRTHGVSKGNSSTWTVISEASSPIS